MNMRKDVKLGFAIGGVLLAVLVVYVLVISGGDDKPDQVSLAQPEPGTASAGRETATASADRQQQPQARQAQPSQSQPTPPVDPFVGSTPATQPSAAPESAPVASTGGGAGNDLWSAALHTGRLPVMLTETPAPVAGAGGASVTPPVPASANQLTPAGTATLASPPLPITASNTPAVVSGANDLNPSTRPSGSGSPVANATQPRTHVIQPGENFATIAATAYGSSAYYPHLIRANPTLDPRRLRPGMTINLPPLSEVKADSSSSPSSSSSSSSSASLASNSRAPIDPKTEYRVESGDSLARISAKLYGKEDRAMRIYELNKPTIGADPAKLKVGSVLKLPEPPATASR